METMSSEHLSAAINGNGVYTHRGHVTTAPYYIELVSCMAPIFQGLHGQGDSLPRYPYLTVSIPVRLSLA